ncbi:M20/M25/M40 family metallo-hydrolase [Adhaeribacter rhizoryzae]|uniref:M20/M25/M40 family metallo-hydrolase n=1 Tax=Adhaeribacter rhizoryzae TaxID=2607907 RepID=A0A5M6D7K1_9BACT|nr:M20/M25/M40 family metallo-hydrolase [Adhaeribacter rhizoryzae]KAA5543524.1 M20/M25/M40 family metallo-hydrolase [Adhaeribacter rhizoryzae]
MPNRRYLSALLLFFILVALSLLSIYLLRPPRALLTNAPETEFAAGRAMQHVNKIAQQPHSMGTAAHRQVREYLLTELKELGLQTEVQATVVSNQALRRSAMAYVQNVIGVFKGTGTGKAILLMAHYDSQPNTFGAGDDGAGVAALLEVARALRSGPPLQNDVIFLLTDGEEFGLFGARAFLQHSLAQKIGLVINLEGRGNSGPSLTFEISPENGWIIEQFARAAPYPLASSLMYEIYRILPNDTDFSVFRQAGYSGFNSAFVDGYVHYHKLTDTPANLNQNSLQHHGSNTLALVRHLGNLSLNTTKAPDKVFFNPIGSWLVHYPASHTPIWVVITGISLFLFLVAGFKSKAFTLWQLLKGLIFYLLIFTLVAGLLVLLNQGVVKLMPFHRFINGVYNADLFFLAYVLVALGLFLLLTRLAYRFTSAWGLAGGVYLIIYGLIVAIYLTIPAAVFILLFPLLFCTLAGLGVILWGVPDAFNWWFILILVAGFLPAISLLVPLASLTAVVFALQLAVVPMLVLLLFWGLAIPLIYQIDANLRWRSVPLVSVILLTGGGYLTAAAVYLEKPSPAQPLHSDVSYYLDVDQNKAFWASGYTKPDEWNKQFFGNAKVGLLAEYFPAAATILLKSQAKRLPLTPPVAEVIADTIYQGQRKLKIHLRSEREATQLQIDIISQTEEALQEATINGVKIPNPKKIVKEGVLLTTLLLGLPEEKGVELQLTMAQTGGVRLLLYDRSVGLPEALIKQKRPAHVIPEQGINSHITVVKKAYFF